MIRLLDDGALEGVKAVCHFAACLLFAVFAVYNGAALVRRALVWSSDPSLLRLCIGCVAYLLLAVVEWVIVRHHLADW